MKLESALDAKKTKAGAISSGWAGRFMGVSAPCMATSSGALSATLSGVQTGPGDTQLTRIFLSTRFFARALVKAWIAPLVAE